MGYKTITQIILTVIALIIVFMYIQPKLLSIRETQDELFQYADASNKATELNAQLSQLVGIEQSFRTSDKVALNEYLPSVIDDMGVMSDIETMARQSGIRIIEMSAGELELPVDDALFQGERIETEKTSHLDFGIQLNGPYESMKAFLQRLEQNKYPLEITEFSFGEFSNEDIAVVKPDVSLGGNYEMTLRTYAYSHIDN